MRNTWPVAIGSGCCTEVSWQSVVNDRMALLPGYDSGDSLFGPEDINQLCRRHHHRRAQPVVRYGILCHPVVDSSRCPSSMVSETA